MRRREVVYFTDSRGFAGAERVLLTLLEGIDRTRWRATLAHHSFPGVEPLVRQARLLDVETWSVAPMPHGARGTAGALAFARALRARHLDVFHAHLTWPLAAKNALLAALAARVGLVLATVHLYMDVPLTRGMALQQRLIGAGLDRAFAVSAHNAARLEELLHWPHGKLDVIHTAVDPAAYTRHPDPNLRKSLAGDRPLVLTVARLDEQKGHRHLLAAATELREAVFVLAGDGPNRASLQKLARELGVEERVRFLGEREDVADLLAVCDVFALPSLYEGLPVSVLEAMAAERVVVATAVGGTGEAIVDGVSGLLVPPKDPGALAAALARVLSDERLRSRLAGAGRARVASHFSASEMVTRVTDSYELLAPRPR